jgi:hypothetical protein
MSLTLIENFDKFAVFEHTSGKGVIAQTAYKGSKNNAAIFGSVGEALNTALAVAWGNSLTLTHRIKLSAIQEAVN